MPGKGGVNPALSALSRVWDLPIAQVKMDLFLFFFIPDMDFFISKVGYTFWSIFILLYDT